MVVDVQAFGQEILDYTAKASKDMSLTLDEAMADLKAIFKKFNINDSNFMTIEAKTYPEQGVSVMPYIRKKAENILRKRDHNKERSENNSQAGQDAKEKASEKQNKSKGKKRPIALNITDWGPIEPEQLGNHISQLLITKGNFSPEELKSPLPGAGGLNYAGASMDLNIQSENAVDQMVETIKKLYFVLVKGLPVKFVRNLSMTELSRPIITEQSIVAHKTNDGACIHKSADSTEDIYVSANTNNNSASTNVSNEDALTAADFVLLKEYRDHGIFLPGVGTHTELQELINSGKVPSPKDLDSESHNHFSEDTIAPQKN